MKSFSVTLLMALFVASSLFAQSDKYTGAMKKNIAELDAALKNNSMAELAGNFERIATAEKTQWLPYYYAAYCTVMSAYMEQDKSKTDAIADKADAFIKKAEELAGAENSETCIIKSMIASAHMMVDPQARWMQYGQTSASNIEKAKKMDATNPRSYYLDAQSKFYTPEAFGGGKTVAKPIFEKAIELFGSFKPASELHPSWGLTSAQYFLSQCN